MAKTSGGARASGSKAAPRAEAGAGVTVALRLAPRITPRGRLLLDAWEDAPALEPGLAARLQQAFDQGAGPGLLQLGGRELAQALPAALAYWRDFAGAYLTARCRSPALGEAVERLAPPSVADLEGRADAVPPMRGAEYVDVGALRGLWEMLDEAFRAGREASGASLQDYLASLDSAWNAVGRVHFNLAENPRDPTAPFAFLATYTDRISALGRAQHQPLGQALRASVEEADKGALLSLLQPVQRAAADCPWLRDMVAAGEIFHPLRWTPQEAFRFLGDVEILERAGVVVRMPATWRLGRPSRPRVAAMVGGAPPVGMGTNALLDFRVELTLDGEPLDDAEVEALLAGSRGLALLRGRWVEVDPERIQRTLKHFRATERLAAGEGLTFAAAARLLVGTDLAGKATQDVADLDWSTTVAGPWLAETLRRLRGREGLAGVDPGAELRGSLRPYQQVGLRWLHLLTELGLGACLADDMGLGKTIQVLALLLVQRQAAPAQGRRASLLVAPASLLANWGAELQRFAPSLRAFVAHPSAHSGTAWKVAPPEGLAELDLVITSYGSLLRTAWLVEADWQLVILDEAQAIKNPETRQTRTVKKLRAHARIALTGTPVENRLSDLWSIFDFLDPGLLGSATQFTRYAKQLADRPSELYGPLRELVRPYILRRLKTDRTVITDLPDKTEVKAFCSLTRKQVALYQQSVEDLRELLRGAEGIQRRGAVLSFLLRLKQICNHPSQWLGDGAWAEADSGKWARLREICETVAAKQEKVLVFTQFREIIPPLAAHLGAVFGRPGLVLHGSTPVKERQALVRRFQEDDGPPFFLLSLKAGGSGLNLTAASHVIHFDRWWNPAVENQATDRAFRIGQSRNVLVHKLLCRGTVEEQIDALIESKRQLSSELLEGGGEVDLTSLADDELLRLVSLDLRAALKE